MTPTIHQWSAWMDPAWPVDATYMFSYDYSQSPPRVIAGSGHLISRHSAPTPNWISIDTTTFHYTADDDLPDGDPGEIQSDIAGYLRNIQRAYATQRSYSIGYNWAVDWLGGIWKLRGWDIKCAANRYHNEHTMAILVLVDGNDGTTPAADESIRYLHAQAEAIHGATMLQLGHGELPRAATPCPGTGVLSKLHAGVYRYSVTPQPKDEDMAKIYLIEDSKQQLDPAQFVITGTYAEWVSTEDRSNALVFMGIAEHEGTPGILPVKPFKLDRGFLKSFTLVGAAPTYVSGYVGPRTSAADFAKWVA